MRHRKGSGWHEGVQSEWQGARGRWVVGGKKSKQSLGMRGTREKDEHARTVSRMANLRGEMYAAGEGR